MKVYRYKFEYGPERGLGLRRRLCGDPIAEIFGERRHTTGWVNLVGGVRIWVAK